MLKRVSIQNFKSLKDVTLDLQKVNLLIGPNNSGKSNFLKALEFCKNVLEKENRYYYHLKYKQDLNNEILIQLVFESSEPFRDEKYEHFLFIETPQDGHDFIIEASTELANTLEFDLDIDTTKVTVGDLEIYTGKIIIYKPELNKIVSPGPVGLGEEFVNADASNIVGFLDLILSKYRKSSFQKIESDLNKCLPEFDEIKLDDYTVVGEKESKGKSYKKIGLANSEREVTYWADELSEGTLYFLALLCIINQPNPPKLLLLEEPEKGIHPRRIEEVVSLIFDLAEEKDIQVIMTTHSPIVVDMFKDIPESVFIFDKDEEGATYVKNLQKDIIEPETAESERSGFDPPHYLNGLGQAWKVGLIGGVPR